MTDIKMLMIEDLVTGKLTNFSPMTVDKCIAFVQNQEKINNHIDMLFENVSGRDRYVFNNKPQQPVNNMQVLQISAIDSGLTNKAMQSFDFADHGSDYVDLLIVKEVYENFRDKLILSDYGQNLLERYNIEIEQLDAFDTDELLYSIKNNQENKSVGYITQKTNTFLVHAISDLKPTYFDTLSTKQTLAVLQEVTDLAIPTGNSPLTADAKAINKIQLARSITPELCCSSFINGGGPFTGHNFGFSQIGLIISNGLIINANNTDNSSTVNELGSRNQNQDFNTNQQHVENIFQSRTNHENYNEILIKNPEFAGVYLNLDYRNNIFRNTLNIPFEDHYHPLAILNIYQKMQEFSVDSEKALPILAIHNGALKELSFNMEALKEYLPSVILNDFDDYINNTKRYDNSVPLQHLSEDDADAFTAKMHQFRKLSSNEVLEKFFILGEPLTQKNIHEIGKEHQISDSRKIELIENNLNVIKSSLGEHKINEIKSTLGNTELSMNFSIFENLKIEKNNNLVVTNNQRNFKIS